MKTFKTLTPTAMIILLINSGYLIMGGAGKTLPTNTEMQREVFQNVSTQVNLTRSGSFYAWGDINNDGNWDLLINGRYLYENSGPPDYRFVDVTDSAFLIKPVGTYMGVWGDYDGDGDLDIFIGGRLNYPDYLYRNNGNGTFSDVTIYSLGATDTDPTTAATWFDYDRDGYLDLYVVKGEDWNNGNYKHFPDRLYHNNGDGTFSDVTSSAGVDTSSNPAYGRGVQLCDFDEDGFMDLYVSNYRLKQNYLWHNNGNGTFTDLAVKLGVAGVYDPHRYYDSEAGSHYGRYWWGPEYGHTIGSSWGDLDGDTHMDLFTSNLAHKYVGPTTWPSMPYDIRGYVCDDSKLYRNFGPPDFNFTDVRNNSGIPFKPIGGSGVYIGDELFSGVALGDYDNDGDLDIFIPQIYNLSYAHSYLYRNDGSMHFTNVADSFGVRVFNTYAGVWADYDNDGDLDLITGGKYPFMAGSREFYETHLFKNTCGGRFIEIRLQGQSPNTFGIGARVTLRLNDGSVLVGEMTSGEGCHGHQSPPVLHFGLGDADINTIEVRWPSGKVHRMVNVNVVNEIITIREGDGGAFNLLSYKVNPPSPKEDQNTTLLVDVTPRPYSYFWDVDGDNRWDYATSIPKINFSFPQERRLLIRLWTFDNNNIGREFYPVEVDVRNVPPTITTPGFLRGFMESPIKMSVKVNDTPSDRGSLLLNWSFGDGRYINNTSRTSVNHTYLTPGDYIVIVRVFDNDGGVGAGSFNVSVINPPPNCNFTVIGLFEEDYSILFRPLISDTPSQNSSIKVKWDFGDDVISEWVPPTSIYHTYRKRGNYTITMTAKDPMGETNRSVRLLRIIDPLPTINYTGESIIRTIEDEDLSFEGVIQANDNPSDISTLKFMWDFGDGDKTNWISDPDVSHIYTSSGIYQALCYVKDDSGGEAYAGIEVNVENLPPKVELSRNMLDVYEDENFSITASGKDTPTDERSLRYSWLVDGHVILNWCSVSVFNYSFSNKGNYNITAEVKDEEGLMNSSTCLVIVENRVPKGRIEVDKRYINEEETVHLKLTDLSDSSSDIPKLRIIWLKNDKQVAEGKKLNITFYRSGSYRITAEVIDDNSAMWKDEVKITVNNVKPSARMVYGKISEKLYYFNASSTSDTPSDKKNLSYLWDFGDGGRGDGMNVTHKFSPGRYIVTLRVEDDDGLSDSYSVTIDAEKKTSVVQGRFNYVFYFIFTAAVMIFLTLLFLFLRRRGISPPAKGSQEPQPTPPGDLVRNPPDAEERDIIWRGGGFR